MTTEPSATDLAAAPESVQAWVQHLLTEIETLKAAGNARVTELERALARKKFPVLNSGGAKVDFQLVADHGEQAQKNHYQSVPRLAERGGLAWTELYAVLHNKPWGKMDINDAIIACRALDVKYLAALEAKP